MDNNNILIKNHPDYKIDVDFLNVLIKENIGNKSSIFFQKSLNFYLEVENKTVYELSEKQLNWLWELNCVLHDRKQNQEVTNSFSQLSINEKKDGLETSTLKPFNSSLLNFMFKIIIKLITLLKKLIKID